MSGLSPSSVWLAAAVWLGIGSGATAQQVTIGLPQQNFSDNYFEYIGGSGFYSGPGYFFRFGRLPGPAFGDFDPNVGLSNSIGVGGGSHFGRYYWNASTGRATVSSSTTPYLTVTEGVPGSIFIGRTVPFVTGVVPTASPVAGNPIFSNLGAANSILGRIQRGEMHVRNGKLYRGPDPQLVLPPELAARPLLFVPIANRGNPNADPALPLAEQGGPFAIAQEPPRAGPPVPHIPDQPVDRLQGGSSAASPVTSASSRAEEFYRKGLRLEAEGKPGAARLLYQSAMPSAEGELRQQIADRLRALQP